VRLFFCTDHASVWPVGVASVVVASDEDEARSLLDAELVGRGLKPYADEPYTLLEANHDKPGAYVLRDGDY
jgi:hypothetical protein